MREIRDRTFIGKEKIETDDTTFINCNFESVSLTYGGGDHPSFQNCSWGDVGWYFTDGALRTIQWLQTIGSANENGAAFVTDLFRPGNYITE